MNRRDAEGAECLSEQFYLCVLCISAVKNDQLYVYFKRRMNDFSIDRVQIFLLHRVQENII